MLKATMWPKTDDQFDQEGSSYADNYAAIDGRQDSVFNLVFNLH